MENLHNSDSNISKKNSKSSCCPPNQEIDSSCCTATKVSDKRVGFRKGIGSLILGLALVLSLSSAFKIATGSDGTLLPPSIEDFGWMDTNKEVAYVLLKGENEEENNNISVQVESVIEELSKSEEPVEYYELTANDEHYSSFIKEIGIEQVPSIVALGRIGSLTLLSGEDISALKLYKAYISATTPAASCNPAACKPSASGKLSKSCTPAQKAKCGPKKSN